jgi:hypothetical protein
VGFIKHIPEQNIVFLEQKSHLFRERMQYLTNFGDIIDAVT